MQLILNSETAQIVDDLRNDIRLEMALNPDLIKPAEPYVDVMEKLLHKHGKSMDSGTRQVIGEAVAEGIITRNKLTQFSGLGVSSAKNLDVGKMAANWYIKYIHEALEKHSNDVFPDEKGENQPFKDALRSEFAKLYVSGVGEQILPEGRA